MDLKPCPFCGGEAVHLIPDSYDTRYARCDDCFAKGEAKS